MSAPQLRLVGQEECKGEPTCGSKSISFGKLPHAREELSKTTAEEGHAYNNIGFFDVPCLDVVHGEDESCRAEREEAAG